MDLRKQVLSDCDAGLGAKAVAEKYRVSPAWVRRLKQRRREEGRIGPKSCRNTRVPQLDAYADRIREVLAATPGITLKELKNKLGVGVAVSTLWLAVAKLGLTVKKSRPGREIGPLHAKKQRDEWEAPRPQ